jgi:predicted MPP superfamily phosphohydrolase
MAVSPARLHAPLPAHGERLDERYVARRRGVERDHETQVFGQSRLGFNIENARLVKAAISWAVRLSLMEGRGKRNAAAVELREHRLASPRLPGPFDGFRVLQVSDLHADMSAPALVRTAELAAGVTADLTVLTGDFRGPTAGPFDVALAEVERLLPALPTPVYAVLGNHDSIDMVPPLEAMGVRCLVNESVALARGEATIHLAGVDDAHFYRMDNLDHALADVPLGAFTILLSHTPELWRQAAHSDVDLMLSGHTHGGQICLPGGAPLFLSAKLPRRLGRGSWRHHGLVGYTSVGCGACVVPVRFNCPPEITLHVLERGEAQ